MKQMSGAVLSALALSIAVMMRMAAWGAGFSLYEASSVGTAMGGALVGKACDASANFYNPATLSDLTNITVTLGFVTEHPRSRIKVNGEMEGALDPGFFVLPHFQLAVPLPWDFAFGLGIDPEFGLGTSYDDKWAMNWNSVETTVQGFVLNPNLSYAITDWWSLAVGLRWLYFDFEQSSCPQNPYGSLSNRLKANNRFVNFGWQLGTRFKVTGDFSVGAVYKSKIDATVRGKCDTDMDGVNVGAVGMAAQGVVQQYALMGKSLAMSQAQGAVLRQVCQGVRAANGPAEADIELPQSLAVGFNWDITKKWHFGSAFSWTDWSSIDTLVFQLPQGNTPYEMRWKDSYRIALAPSWDFADDWTAMVSYVYDTNACSGEQESVMLPPGGRHIMTFGISWRCWRGMELALSYGIVFMESMDMHVRDAHGRDYEMSSHRGLSHAAGLSVTYRF